MGRNTVNGIGFRKDMCVTCKFQNPLHIELRDKLEPYAVIKKAKWDGKNNCFLLYFNHIDKPLLGSDFEKYVSEDKIARDKLRHKNYYYLNKKRLIVNERIRILKNKELGIEKKKYKKPKEASFSNFIKYNYGIDRFQYNEILKLQNFVCKICKQFNVTQGSIKMCLDHCHATGKIRGIICKNCNTALGVVKDNIQILENAKEYLLNNGNDIQNIINMNLIEDSYISFVNLDSREDRLARMNQSLGIVKLNAIRTPGILPDIYENDPKFSVMWNRTKGAIGCYLSQMQIIKTALSKNKNAIVFEDDLIFCKDFKYRMDYISAWSSTHEWDIIWLGATFHVNPPYWHKDTLGKDAEITDDERMVRTYGSFCTYAYIVNKNSLDKVLKMLEDWIPNSIGIDFSMIKMSPHLKTFAFVPGCITQYDNQSNIGTGWTYFSKFSKLNGTEENSAYWWQDTMEDFDPQNFNWAEASVK